MACFELYGEQWINDGVTRSAQVVNKLGDKPAPADEYTRSAGFVNDDLESNTTKPADDVTRSAGFVTDENVKNTTVADDTTRSAESVPLDS